MWTTWKKQLMAVGLAGVILIGGTILAPKRLMAQVRAALVRDEDSPGRNAFQVAFDLNISGGLPSVPITVPAGKRMVIDYVAINGAAGTAGPYIQPYVLIQSSVNGGPAINYYMLAEAITNSPGQFHDNEVAHIYGDTASVGLAFAGYTPTFMVMHICISGHMIDMP
jgi:hypothetical protein